jgi:hypothetical protein
MGEATFSLVPDQVSHQDPVAVRRAEVLAQQDMKITAVTRAVEDNKG